MKVISTKIVNGKKMFLIEEPTKLFAQNGFSSNPYYVPIQGSISDNTKTKLSPKKELSKEEIKQLQKSPTSVKNIKAKEVEDKNQRLKLSEQAYQKRKTTGIQSSQDLANETGAIGDKIALQNIPYVGKYIPNILDVTQGIGNMASGLGRIPLNLEKGNYGQAALSVAMPLGVGALAGVGAENTGQFVNNLVNPLAGTGELINNLGNKYLPNVYKLNPWAFKPQEGMMYRGVGEPAITDAIESGIIRQNPSGRYSGTDLFVSPNYNVANMYSTSAKLADKNVKKALIEIPKDAANFIQHDKFGFHFRTSDVIPTSKAKLYKQDWLKGYKEVPKPTTPEDLVDLYRIQENGAKSFAQLAAEGKIPQVFNKPEILARKAEEEKYFGQWFTNDKNDLDWYLKDREFTNPEIIHLKVPKSKLSQYQQYDKTLSRAPDREFVIPFEEQKIFKSAIGNNGMFNMTNPLAGIKLKANLPEGTVINGVSLNPFKGKIDKKIELIPVPSKFRGEDAYNIKYGDKFIGDFDFEKINDRYVPFSISIDKEYRGQGLGKEAYEVANKLLKSQGKGSLHSSGFFIGDNAKHVWRSLEKTGKAEKIGEDSWKFLKFGGTVKVLDTKIENNKKYYLINE